MKSAGISSNRAAGRAVITARRDVLADLVEKRRSWDKDKQRETEIDFRTWIVDESDFTKMREDFRHETTTELAELDKEIAELEAETETLEGTKKTEREANLTTIRGMRERFDQDYKSIETASSTTWDQTKTRLEKQLKELDEAIDKAD